MIKIEANVLSELNQIYKELLHRNVDEYGIRAYGEKIKKGDRVTVKHMIKKSAEYKQLHITNIQNNTMNSMSGDRKTHFFNNDTSMIDNHKYGNLLNKLLQLIIDISSSSINKNNIKLSILNSIAKNLKITIFPHKEYYFNTNIFIDSLKNFDNFVYFVLFLAITNVIKGISNKMVATCGTQQRLELLNNIDINNFNELFSILNRYVLDYLAVRICGTQLTDDEIILLTKYCIEKNSSKIIDYLENKVRYITNKENALIETYLKNLSIKPKVLVHIAYLENQEPHLLQKMLFHAYNLQAHNPLLDINLYFENDRVNKEVKDYTPWSRVKRIRNIMLSRTNLNDYDYLYVIDSDIVSYPYDFVSRAIGLNPNGITAPVMLIENSNVFYDWCGYQKKNHTSIKSEFRDCIMDKSCAKRNFSLQPPYVNDDSRLVEIDCVGCTYVVPTKVFKEGYGNLKNELLEVFKLAKVSNHKINENIVQYEDHPTFTDHYTICAALRSQGGKVYMDRGSVAYHADLPIYGENWH